ncbi:unnamed protein product [Mucor circinelloides]|uniref:Uncharacterized protein n=1 Tax=Mucor circinelloides f. circinelloides (strain 1006PhL) TaxID=1220926 RepID=S2J988_MUCC1|nr:hypothetical protein HMPREF1544_06492 [Mucor circinelloides 1006PhL]KAG1059419.1 hypothetical protein G6F42_028324 [Rhizopus arrhizus]
MEEVENLINNSNSPLSRVTRLVLYMMDTQRQHAQTMAHLKAQQVAFSIEITDIREQLQLLSNRPGEEPTTSRTKQEPTQQRNQRNMTPSSQESEPVTAVQVAPPGESSKRQIQNLERSRRAERFNQRIRTARKANKKAEVAQK